MRINENLNLVIPIDLENTSGFIHSTPISLDVFRKYFEPMSIALSSLYSNGSIAMAPRIAALQLEKEATALGVWDTKDGVKRGLINEIKRLTNLVLPSDSNGWESIPYSLAIEKKLLTEEDQLEIDNLVVFFILVSGVHRKGSEASLQSTLPIWGCKLTRLNCTEFRDSLQTLTDAENTPEADL